MTVPLEVEHGVDDVLQHLGAGETAVLRHVPDDEDRHVAALGHDQEAVGRVAHLGDGARGGLELDRVQRLDRVDDDQVRRQPRHLVDHPLQARLRQHVQPRRGETEALSAPAHLMRGLLARAVEDGPPRRRDLGRRLQQQRRLPDAQLAPQQDQRPRHEAPAQHPVELADPGRDPVRLRRLDVGEELRGRPAEGRPRTGPGRSRGDLLDQRVPLAAVGAPAQPLPRLGAARLADVDGVG